MDGNGDDLERQRKRLRFRSWHRGTKEMDILLGSFADRHLAAFTAMQLDRYDTLLQNSDPDLYAWLSGSESVPQAHDNDVMRLLMDFKIKT